MQQLRKFLCTALVALGLMTTLATTAEATHGRHAHMSWKQVGVNTVEFTITSSWRRDFPFAGGPFSGVGGLPITGDVVGLFDVMNFGDASGSPALEYVVTAYDVAENWVTVVARIAATNLPVIHTYSGPGPWVAKYDGCCRISESVNAADAQYIFLSTVNLALTDESPVSAEVPIVSLAKNGIRTFLVPGSDPDQMTGNVLKWRLATPTESGIPFQPGPPYAANALTIDSLTGLVTWNTAGLVTGSLWSIQVVIQERSAANVLLTAVPVDFIIKITDPPVNVSPPVLEPGSPTCGTTLNVLAGTPISFTVSFSDPDVGDHPLLNGTGVPPGATMTPPLPVHANPATSTFLWTPSIGQVGSWVIQFSATDHDGLQTLCSYTINVTGQPPLCNADGPHFATCVCSDTCTSVTLNGTGSADPDGGPLTYAWSAPGIVFDNPASATPTGCFPVGNTVVTLVVSDNQGLNSTCVTGVTVTADVTPPGFPSGCGGNTNAECLDDVPPPSLGGVGPFDICDPTPTLTVTRTDNGGDGCAGFPLVITDTYTATDDCGNASQCLRTYTIIDTTAPVVTCPPGYTVQCFGDIQPCDANDATAVDNCGGAVTITCSDGIPTGDCGGFLERTFTATDACGNVGTCTQTILIQDTIPPVITCAPGFSVQCRDDVPPCDESTVSASDNCGFVEVECVRGGDKMGASVDCGGSITRRFRATDACGNTATCEQVITFFDDIAPSITCPASLTINCGESTDPAFTGSATGTDNCDDEPAITYLDSEQPGNCPAERTISREWFATDMCSNVSSCIQLITVQDANPPVLTCPASLTVECDASTDPEATGTATAEDNCDTAAAVTYADAVATGNCPNESVITRTWTAVDDCGNSISCDQIITVDDTEAPTITCPAAITVDCDASTEPANTGIATATDNCYANPIVSRTDVVTHGACTGGYTITRTWRAVDGCDNASTCTQTITVQDTVAPTIVYCPTSTTVTGLENLPVCDASVVVATDNCGSVTVTCDRSSFGGVGCSGTPIDIVYTYTATDDCGNSSSCSRIVTVVLEPCNFFVSVGASAGTEVEAASGSQLVVPVRIDQLESDIKSVNLAFGFDPSALTLLNVTRGDALSLWSQFSYEIATGDDGVSRVVTIRSRTDVPEGAQVPSNQFKPEGVIANLHFAVAGDRNLEQSLQTVWSAQETCGDNCLTSRNGELAYVPNEYTYSSCSAIQGQVVHALTIDAGRIRITEPVQRSGDINLNGVANEVGDAVLFIEYLTYDESVLSADPAYRAIQIAATDVNGDGITGTVADLVYLVRVVTGDVSAIGTASVTPYVNEAMVNVRIENGVAHLSATSTARLGGAMLVFRTHGVEPGQPELATAAAGMNIRTSSGNGRVKVLIYGWEKDALIEAGSNDLFSMPLSGNGTLEFERVEIADEAGSLLRTSSASATVPTEYALGQNYPNPFNAGTVIPVQLSEGGAWMLSIYNIAGQTVRRFEGSDAAGNVRISWNGRNDQGDAVPSGIYFYRVTLPSGETMSRKMTLLK